MAFLIYVFLLSVPAIIFSILAWRLRTPAMFWTGLVFGLLLLIFYLYEIEFILATLLDIESALFGFFLLVLLGLPVYFLIASKTGNSSLHRDSDITDDYLNKIIDDDTDEPDFE